MSALVEKGISLARYVIKGTEMSYTSLVFFACLIGFLAVFFLLRPQWMKRIWILIANLIFYVWAGDRASLIILLGTAVIVYLVSRRIETVYKGFEAESAGLKPKEKMHILDGYKKRTRRWLWLALVLILAVWVFVKVCKFADMETVGRFRDFSLLKNIIVPLGISYYSLSAIGYLLDVYWRKTKPEHNFLTFFGVMSYFPHIVQGPISKYQKLLKQMNDLPKFDYTRVCYGLQLMLWGYLKKLVIADRLALYTEAVFASPADYAGVEILLAVILCVFQLYADFSGCMDIVRGISQAIGIDLDENFRQPLFSKSAPEFWRRWHITLGTWMKDYIYFPIATNPRFIKWTSGMKKSGKRVLSSLLKTLIPSFVVWLLTGLWHGTGLDYVVWGLYWCVLIVLSSELKPLWDRLNSAFHIQTDGRLMQAWRALRTSACFGIGRMFTVAGGLAGCGILWRQLFASSRLWTLIDGSIFTHGMDAKDFFVAVIGIALMMLVDVWHERGIKIRETIAAVPLPVRWAVYLATIFVILIFGIYGSGYNAASFIYGAF